LTIRVIASKRVIAYRARDHIRQLQTVFSTKKYGSLGIAVIVYTDYTEFSEKTLKKKIRV
jgi:hypothetical protein